MSRNGHRSRRSSQPHKPPFCDGCPGNGQVENSIPTNTASAERHPVTASGALLVPLRFSIDEADDAPTFT